MKLQHLAIIFVVIIIPISMVMSQYLQTQMKTIELQTSYTNRLNTATADAMKAFQINTINNRYSDLSDSKIRDIEASVNTFYNSLGTKMETYASTKNSLEPFVPAIVFNLYDGYYIHSLYKNDTSVKRDDMQDVKEYVRGLKPFIYYSCRYKGNGKDIIVNFTLDNQITIYGKINNKYVTKSGYLINPNRITDVNEATKTLKYDGVTIGAETLKERLMLFDESAALQSDDGVTVHGRKQFYNYVTYNNQKIYEVRSKSGSYEYFWYSNNKASYMQEASKREFVNSVYKQGGQIESVSAFEFYKKAKEFSEWVKSNLGDIKQSHIIDMQTHNIAGYDYLSFKTLENIFEVGNNNDPMLAGSIFNSHRMAVIRKSIETNVSAAMVNYSGNDAQTFDFVMPEIDEQSWAKITNNVSIISFMQGIPLAYKYYNNYSVITSTKNEEVINAQSIYILANDAQGRLEYHQPGCKVLIESASWIGNAYTTLSFARQKYKESEVKIRYFYPQNATGCYECIVNATGYYDIDEIVTGKRIDPETKKITNTSISGRNIQAVRKSYLTALARERYDLYKSNFDLR